MAIQRSSAWLVPLGLSASLVAACSDGGPVMRRDAATPVDLGALDAGNADASTPDAGPPDAGPPCLPSETECSGACIVGSDCSRAVRPATAADAKVFINGNVFVQLAIGDSAGVTSARVADAVVAFQARDATHLWIEVPPGRAGTADITLSFGATTVITRRALLYRSGPEGTTWTRKTMSIARGGFPGMARTFDDRVLVAAGYTAPTVADCTDSADLFDRTAAASTLVANTMATKRWTTTATTVIGGKTIVAGSCYTLGCPYDSQAIDLYDPVTNRFTPAGGRLSIPRAYLRSVALADGRVLYTSAQAPTLEIYDPVADVSVPVTASPVLTSPQQLPAHLARLRDGRVLIVPGASQPNVILDPRTGAVTPTGDSLQQVPDALVSLGDGRVFAIGGVVLTDEAGVVQQTTTDLVSVFDPTTGRFSPWSARLGTSRTAGTVVLARSGVVYYIGGFSGTARLNLACSGTDFASLTLLSSVEILDPDQNTVAAGPALPEPNLSLRSTILADGSILAGGGTPCGPGAMSYASVYFLEAPPLL